MTAKKSGTPSWSLNAAELRSAFDRVKHAAAVDEARPMLAAILIEQRGSDIRLVAADNYRIAMLTLPVEITGEWKPAVLPLDDLPTIQAFLKSRSKSTLVLVERVADDRLRIADVYHGAVEVRLIEGTFPNIGIVTDPLDAEEAQGLTVAINPRFLGDIKRGLGPDDAGITRIQVFDALKPVSFTIGDDYREIIMPVRVTT